MKKVNKILKWLGFVVATPIILFLLLAILIYIPPIQNFVVHRVASSLSNSMGITFTVERVRLAFPLDLAVHNVTATEKNDTLLHTRSIRLNVALMPLFSGRADIDGFELYNFKLDTKSYISDTHVKGTADELSAISHGIEWGKEFVNLDEVTLRNADFYVTLSDTAQKDTTESETNWNILVEKAKIERSKIHLTMPGDSMRFFAYLDKAILNQGSFDIGKNNYAIHSLLLRNSEMNYDIPYLKETKGLDANHIHLTGLSLTLNTLSYNNQGVLRAGLQNLCLKEKSGIEIERLSGGIYMDSVRLQLPALRMRTSASRLDADVAFDFSSLNEGKGGHLSAILDASIGYGDILTVGKGYLPQTYLQALPKQPLFIKGEISGNIDHLRIKNFSLQMPSVANFQASGYTRDILNERRSGQLKFSLKTQNLSFLRYVLPKSITETINIPNGLTAQGNIGFFKDTYDLNTIIGSGHGTIQAKAHADLRNENYNIAAKANRFPLSNFVKGIAIGPFSGTLRASGKGFDFTSPQTSLTADANINALTYEKYDLSGISFNAHVRNGQVNASFSSNNELFEANGNIRATMGSKKYHVAVVADLPSINLTKLGVTSDTLLFGTHIDIQAQANKSFTTYSANGCLTSNHFTTPRISAMAKDLCFDFQTSTDTTLAHISAGDLLLHLGSKGDINKLTAQINKFTTELSKQIEDKELNQEYLKQFLPNVSFSLDAGQDNPLYNFARMKGYSFSAAHIKISSSPQQGMKGYARTGLLNLGNLLIDTLDTHIVQDTTGVQLYGLLKNEKDNPVPMAVLLKGYILSSGAGVELKYIDSDNETGVELGLQANIEENGINVHLYPEHPILAYRNFTVNTDNFVFLGKDKSIRADINLLADDGTGLKIYGEPQDSLNDITVSVNQLNLGELSTVLPYLPKLSGMLSGDIHLTDGIDHKSLSAMASINAEEFKYEGIDMGNLGIDAIYLPKAGGEHHASAFISTGEEEVLSCNGTYFDRNGGYFEGDANLHNFPLQLLNGFLAGTDVALKGIAAGDISVKGTTDNPILNGSLDLDSAHIYSDVYGFDFRTDERAVEIKDSRLVFDQYNLYSTGTEPLVLNGTFDMSNFEKMSMDFTMKANNFELINTQKKAQSMVFGKVYTNFMGLLKGTTDNLSIRGKLDILDRTDVTYILKDSPLSVDDRLSDLVEFVNFADTTSKKEVKAVSESGMDITLGITISDAAQFNCNLSEDGQSYVKLEGGGDLTLRMTQQGDMRLTGRFTTNSGELKYALPVIPLKTFQLEQGSYVEFTGDMMNPTLNITAKESTKATITENDVQRTVAFNVGVVITQTLSNMGLEFTIEAPEDLSVQNQIAAMSAAQRSKAAVAMMATGMFMTDDSMMSGSGFKANNALNAFLQSEIQNIAGSALKTIDISLGVESGTSEVGTSTTDYSFQFAKRFWGNKISVIIEGKVSTGADAQNSAESFINNVSVEYRLDDSATRYVKVFYDRDTQDPLEGQITKTGAGLVLRRKTDRLGELFIFKKRKNDTVPSVNK